MRRPEPEELLVGHELDLGNDADRGEHRTGDLVAHRFDPSGMLGRVADTEMELVDFARRPHDLEETERAGVDVFDRSPHVDRHHRPAVADDLVALPSDGPHPRVGASAAAALAREAHEKRRSERAAKIQRRDRIGL